MTETNTSQGVGKYLIGREATAYGGLVQLSYSALHLKPLSPKHYCA
jgi:hypothetical protein